MRSLPVIDVSPLGGASPDDERAVAAEIDAACREVGFFYISGHGVSPSRLSRLHALAHDFFALDDVTKSAIEMARGGRAWRGWFPLGGELTSGTPDAKEGLYFGAELEDADPRVAAGVPLHGANLFPASPPDLRDEVLAYLEELTELGHRLARGVCLALGLDGEWMRRELMADPTILFRIFRYPPTPGSPTWGVGEHTDYGLLTILHQDDRGGLEVHGRDGWIDAPPLPGTFVCNLGDMLDRMTGGRYRSTPHRVRNDSGADRVSLAFFFDPSWDAEVAPLPIAADSEIADDAATRWDGTSLRTLHGTYGDYLLGKVSKVFPALREAVEP